MLELIRRRAAVISCFASPETLTELSPPAGAYLCWVAADEAMLVGEPGSAEHLAREARGTLAAGDPDAVVLDVSDGWTAWTLAGDGARDAMARVSELELDRDGYVQGDVARVPVRIIVLGERLHLLVPAMWEEHLRSRIRTHAANLDLRTSPPADWSLT